MKTGAIATQPSPPLLLRPRPSITAEKKEGLWEQDKHELT